MGGAEEGFFPTKARPTGRARDGACVETKGMNAPRPPEPKPARPSGPRRGRLDPVCQHGGWSAAGVGWSDALFGHGLVPAQFLQSPIRDRAGEPVRGLHVGLHQGQVASHHVHGGMA